MQTAVIKQRTHQAGSSNLILHSKLITLESFRLVPGAPFDVKLLLPFIPNHSLGKVPPPRPPTHLPILLDHEATAFEVRFHFDETPRDWKLFFTEGDRFQSENSRRNFKCDRVQHIQQDDGSSFLPKATHTWKNSPRVLIHCRCSPPPPPQPPPRPFPRTFLTLWTKHYLLRGSLRAQLQRGLTFLW